MPARAVSERTVELLRFRQAPVAVAALLFAAGLSLEHLQASRNIGIPTLFLVLAIALFALLSAVALWRAQRVALIPVAALWITLGMAAGAWSVAAPQPLALLGYSDNLSRTVRAHVVRVRSVPASATTDAEQDKVQPWEAAEEVTGRAGPQQSVDLAVDEIEDVTPDLSRMVAITGGVRVSVFGAGAQLACGDRVELPLRLKLPDHFRDPGTFDYAALLLAQGIAARGSVQVDRVQLLGKSAPSLRCRIAAAQSWASAKLLGFADSAANRRLPPVLRLSETDARMLDAMLFGDRSGLSHGLRVGFERTGTFHLFVVSGMHIALLAAGVFWLLRRLRAPEWLATIVTLTAASAYAALTGFGQPSQRALAMTAVFLLTRLLARERDRMPLNALGAAVLAMLVWAPASLFEASFQMTVLAIVAIAGIAIPLSEWTLLRYARAARQVFDRQGNYLPPREAQLRMMLELWGWAFESVLGRWSRRGPALLVRFVLFVLELALIATTAELVMVLPMAMYFHRAAVFALPANMVVVPLVVVLATAGVATFAASLISPWLAIVPGSVTALLLHAVTFAIHHVSRFEAADVRVPGPAAWIGVAAIAGWLACCWLVRRSRWGAFSAAVLVPAIAVLVLWPERPLLHAGVLEVTALDVGQGDSLLAVNPEGSTMLIDAGGPVGGFGGAEVVSNFDLGEEVVSPYLWQRRMRRVDVVVLTHAHTDHMGGMAAVLENFRPRELWVGIDPRSPMYARLLDEAARLGVTVRHLHAGDRQHWGSVEVSVLAPAPAYLNAGTPKNDDSVVLRLDLGKASVLLEGDAERPSEDAMLARGLQPVTLLKVAHHGSRTSTNPEFLAAVRPQFAVVSVGRGNTFGHPRGEVIGRLAAAGTRLFRTDTMGAATFLLTPDGRVVESGADGGASVTVP